MFFGAEKREEIKSKLGPDAKVTEVMVEVAKEWRACPASARVQYTEKALEAKKKYDEEMTKWKAVQKASLIASYKAKRKLKSKSLGM